MPLKTVGECPPCVCGCSRLMHIGGPCKHNPCKRCGCNEYQADDGADGVDDYRSPAVARLVYPEGGPS